jgi:hypothetical protein
VIAHPSQNVETVGRGILISTNITDGNGQAFPVAVFPFATQILDGLFTVMGQFGSDSSIRRVAIAL